MNGRDHSAHPEADRLQALLDGALGRRERALLEAHLATCRRCASELEAWRAVFAELDELPLLRPQPGFAERVLEGVALEGPVRVGAWARVRRLLGSGSGGHPTPELLQDLADRTLPARRARRVRAHLETCALCRTEAARWEELADQLGSLPRHAPSGAFAEAVMARVRLPEVTEVEARGATAGSLAALVTGALAASRRLLPRSRRAWAALSGAAVTPAVTVALVLWTVLRTPALTPTALASFLWWQLGDLASAAGAFLTGAAPRLLGDTGLALWAALASAPLALAAAFVAYAALVLFALRILVRHLITPPMAERTHA